MSTQPTQPEEQLEATAAPVEETLSAAEAVESITYDPAQQQRIDAYLEGLKKEENLMMGLLAGLVAAIVGAVLWGLISVSTGYQIGYMALGVGFLVGFAVRFGGKGFSQVFGISGAILALVGCVLGNLFTVIGFIASEAQISFFEVLGIVDVAVAFELLKETAAPMDVLFYAIAVYQGYRFSFRNVTEEELAQAGNA